MNSKCFESIEEFRNQKKVRELAARRECWRAIKTGDNDKDINGAINGITEKTKPENEEK